MRILCLGDSLTAGVRSTSDDFRPYATTLQKLVDRECGAKTHDVRHEGSCGETAISMARRKAVDAEFDGKRTTPKVVLILAGTNDLLRYPPLESSDIASALEEMAQAASARGARPVVLTVPRLLSAEARPRTNHTARRLELNDLIREGATRCADLCGK